MTDNLPPEPSPRATIIAFVIVTLAIIGGIVLLLLTRPEPVQITINPPLPTATPEPTPTPDPITVYVTGAVNQPESMVSLPAGSRVQDALDAAGGVVDGADLERVNLAQILRDGDQVHVPLVEETTIELPTPSGGTALVYINSATLEELMTLPGVGEALAQRILDFRQANGSFADMSALDAVEGIGPALLQDLEGLIVFD